MSNKMRSLLILVISSSLTITACSSTPQKTGPYNAKQYFASAVIEGLEIEPFIKDTQIKKVDFDRLSVTSNTGVNNPTSPIVNGIGLNAIEGLVFVNNPFDISQGLNSAFSLTAITNKYILKYNFDIYI